jgi:hypothetical protein
LLYAVYQYIDAKSQTNYIDKNFFTLILGTTGFLIGGGTNFSRDGSRVSCMTGTGKTVDYLGLSLEVFDKD